MHGMIPNPQARHQMNPGLNANQLTLTGGPFVILNANISA
jgi:hypothetical protein